MKNNSNTLGLHNMNGLSADDKRTCALNDMNCRAGQPEQTASLQDMNAVNEQPDMACSITNMNCRKDCRPASPPVCASVQAGLVYLPAVHGKLCKKGGFSMNKKQKKEPFSLKNMNGLSHDDARTCALDDMNCLNGQEEHRSSLQDMNAARSRPHRKYHLTDMNGEDGR